MRSYGGIALIAFLVELLRSPPQPNPTLAVTLALALALTLALTLALARPWWS